MFFLKVFLEVLVLKPKPLGSSDLGGRGKDVFGFCFWYWCFLFLWEGGKEFCFFVWILVVFQGVEVFGTRFLVGFVFQHVEVILN